MKEVEYRVRPVTRYIVTRWYREGDGGEKESGGCCSRGEFGSFADAREVASALHAVESASADYSVNLTVEAMDD